MKFRYEVYHSPFPCQPEYFSNYKEVSKFIKEQLNAGEYIESVKKVDWSDIIDWRKGKRPLFDE